MLIKNDEQLRKYFPNVWKTVVGEISFYDRLSPHLETAEAWIEKHLVSMEILEKAMQDDPANGWLPGLQREFMRLAVSMALHHGAPQLDLSLTANGFVTAGTDNVVPISSQRMDRLLESLQKTVDFLITDIIEQLSSIPGWIGTPQSKFFGGSLFQTCSICQDLPTTGEEKGMPIWERFLALRAKAINIEEILADEYFSHPLMDVLRQRVMNREYSSEDLYIVTNIQSEIRSHLSGATLNRHRLTNLVDYIRKHPDKFAEWHSSPLAPLYDPPVFRNKKNSSGYFF